MRFLLGVLVGYSLRGKNRLLIATVTIVVFIVYILLPAIALTRLHVDVRRERHSRLAQIKVPVVKGLTYEAAEARLRESKLNIRVLASRYGLGLKPGLIIEQNPQPGEDVVYGHSVGVTIVGVDSDNDRP